MFQTSKYLNIAITKIIKLSLLLIVTIGFSQNNPEKEQQIFEAFKAYTKLPREISYSHLNKTTLLKGEDLGFTVYILDKNTKKNSQSTTNVYCTLENSSGEIVKSNLLMASGGVAFNTFEIDSLMGSGNYTFKAYTNWMKNFDEQNFYVQDIKIIDPEEKNDLSAKILKPSFDAQFLPEGGHLVANIQNTIGVIIKDSLGFGISNVSGSVIDENNMSLAEFNTNEFGICKFIITPKDTESYKVNLALGDFEEEMAFAKAEASGVNMTITDLGTKIVMTLKSNDVTLPKIKGKTFKLAIHNGTLLKVMDVVFSDSQDISKIIGYSTLYPGINIFTLFDDTNKPVLERLFFNYEGVPILKSNDVLTSKIRDSLLITIPYKNVPASQFSNFSISVLPDATTSYNSHQNIISATFLQPYVKGFVENANDYFSDISKSKKYNLDMLLLTQGWSSYDWTDIFGNPPTARFDFEIGIKMVASLNNSKSKQFIISPMVNTSTIKMDVPENENEFVVKGLLPIDKETVNVTSLNKRGGSVKPSLYVQFNPSQIPNIKNFTNILPLKNRITFDVSNKEPLFYKKNETPEELVEVVINANKKKDRIDKIKRQEHGYIDMFDDITRGSNMDFAAYISAKGYFVVTNDTLGRPTFRVLSPIRKTFIEEARDVLIYLDNVILSDISILNNYNMKLVDYVVINKQGIGEGMRGVNGAIKIFTNPPLTFEGSTDKLLFQEVKIPLTFTASKKFYVPIYSDYRNAFFETYGVIAWLPNEKIDAAGNLSFKIADKGQNLKLFIEGITEDGSFISEEKIVKIN